MYKTELCVHCMQCTHCKHWVQCIIRCMQIIQCMHSMYALYATYQPCTSNTLYTLPISCHSPSNFRAELSQGNLDQPTPNRVECLFRTGRFSKRKRANVALRALRTAPGHPRHAIRSKMLVRSNFDIHCGPNWVTRYVLAHVCGHRWDSLGPWPCNPDYVTEKLCMYKNTYIYIYINILVHI